MIDDFIKHIDKLIKKRLSDKKGDYQLASIPFYVEKNKKIPDRLKWLITLVSQTVNSIHPYSTKHRELIKILSFEISYKQSFKMLCDIEHPMVKECLNKLNANESTAASLIEKVKVFDYLMLDYAELFKDELGDSDNSLSLVLNKITELSTDSFQGAIISHSAKMTHPACKFPRIYAQSLKKSDGFVRTGNVTVDFDMHINATKLKVFKFLSLKIENSTVYNLINENKVALLAKVFSATEDLVTEWVHQFVKVINQQDLRSHSAIKQVFFPIENEYHQLSILTPSGLVFNLKNKIDHINDRSKEAYLGKRAKKSSKHLDSGFSFISGLTVTKHGGDHPKNISGLNNKYQSYYLLPSMPPKLNKRDIHFPQTDFFNQTVRYFQCKNQFNALHELYKQDSNNMHVRAQRDEYYQNVIDHVIEKMWQIRGVALAQYNHINSQLNAAQTTWLCDDAQALRETTDDWLDDICAAITTFLFYGYEKTMGNKAIKLGDAEHKQMKKIVNKNKEALR